jgi:hypothetical protein
VATTSGSRSICPSPTPGDQAQPARHLQPGADIDRSLRGIIDEAERTEAIVTETIPGQGSGALKSYLLRFLDRTDEMSRYQRIEKDPPTCVISSGIFQ